MSDYEIHPLCNIFPQMATAELEELAADIRTNGQQEAIILLDGKIIDGRNRYLACLAEGIEPRVELFDGDDPLAFVVSRNLHRRHLTESQRSMVAARLANLEKHSNQHAAKVDAQICATTAPEVSQSKAAEQLNVSRRSVQQARKVQEQGAPELVAAVDAGAVSVSDAAKISDESAETQRAAVVAVNEGKARTVAYAAKASKQPTGEQRRADAFDKLRKAIGAAVRARDDMASELGDQSPESKAVLNWLSEAHEAANVWQRAAAKRPQRPAATDRLNRPLPERFAAVFARASALEALRIRLNGIKNEFESICQEPVGIFLHAQTLMADIENLKQALKFARPHAVCPYCKGSGCKACRQQGWVPQDVYRVAPSEMKTEQEAA